MSGMDSQDIYYDESLEYPFQCFAEVPSLQEMSAYRVCQAVWHSYVSSQNTCLVWMIRHSDVKHHDRVKESVKGLKIANPIKEILLKAEETTYKALYNWVDFLDRNLNDEQYYLGPDLNIEDWTLQIDISWCVWLSNGLLDYRRSADEMLKSGRLNEMQKFIIMSKFCMEDKIKTIRSTSLPHHVQEIQFSENPLQFYWICYLKNNLGLVPLNENSTLEKTMTVFCYDHHEKIGLEYFWFRMTNNDRISTADRMMTFRRGYDELYRCEILCQLPIFERLLSYISSSSTESLARLSVKYLNLSVSKSSSLQHQLRIWHRFKNQITDLDFASIINSTFHDVIASEDRMRLLVDMWDTAFDHHRQYVAEHEAVEMITEFMEFKHNDKMDTPCPAASIILYRLLSLKPEDERSRLFKQHAVRLASRIEPLETLKNILNLCLPSTIEQAEFKITFSRSEGLQRSCVSLLQQGKHANLNDKLAWVFFNSGPNAINDYKKSILTLMTWKYADDIGPFFSSIGNWNDLSEFIDKTYAEDTQSAYNVKRTLFEQAISMIRWTWSRPFLQYFDITKQIIDSVLPIQDLKYFKRKHLDIIVDEFRRHTYWKHEYGGDEIFLPNFVEWCCDYDEESISEFKKSLPLDAIIGAVTAFGPLYDWRVDLEKLLQYRLDRYIKWIVGSDEGVREYKLRAVERCTINVMTFINPYDERDVKNLRKVLRWLHDGDEKAARKFEEETLQIY